MDTAPISTYEGAAATFTWADNEFMLVVITILGFGFSLWALWKFVSMEKAHLDAAAARLSGKYSRSE
jgi:hypothetical protein